MQLNLLCTICKSDSYFSTRLRFHLHHNSCMFLPPFYVLLVSTSAYWVHEVVQVVHSDSESVQVLWPHQTRVSVVHSENTLLCLVS